MDIIIKYFPNLSATQKKQFLQLQDLYIEWNSKINVISRKDISHLYIRHILHSLSIAKVINFKDGSKVLDVGTGGGFPGIPLAIMFPRVNFLLVDSIGKKIKVVNQIASSIKLSNIKVEHRRAEQVKGEFDFVISRAVSNIKVLNEWVKLNISNKHNNKLSNGIFCLKGGNLSEELIGLNNVKEINISDFFKEAFFETKKVVYIPC